MRRLARVGFVLVLLLSAGTCAFFVPRGIETDIFSAVGKKSVPPLLVALNSQSGSQIRVLSLNPALTSELRAIYPFDPSLDPTNLFEVVRTKGDGLLTAKTRERLEKGEVDKIRRSVLRRDYTGVGIFAKDDDPYYFLHDFVMSLKSLKPDLPEGAEVLTGSVRDSLAKSSLAPLLDFSAAHPDSVYLSGAPFHTAVATEKTKCEVSYLGAISLFGVFFFGFLLFRSLRFILPTGLLLGSGFLVASAAVFVLPGRPHALTFLFGTSLIGLGVDYCYHAMAAVAPFRRRLTGALLSTVATFLPLLFLGVGVLTEMAVFTIVGLVAIYWGVLAWSSR